MMLSPPPDEMVLLRLEEWTNSFTIHWFFAAASLNSEVEQRLHAGRFTQRCRYRLMLFRSSASLNDRRDPGTLDTLTVERFDANLADQRSVLAAESSACAEYAYGDLHTVGGREFVQNSADVGLYRRDADEEFGGDLGV